MKLKVSAIQFEYVSGDKEANLKKTEKLLDEVAKSNVKLACLQEYFLTGYPKKEWAEPIPGSSINRLAKKCREHRMYLVAGSMVEKHGDRYYATSALINPDGEIVGKYRKINLLNFPPKLEINEGLIRGAEVPIFETEIGKLGILMGADLDPCEPCRILCLKECEILLAPHSCTSMWVDAHRYLLEARAWEDMFYIVAPNPCGVMKNTPWGNFQYLGSSRIISPMGEVLANAGEFEDGVAVAAIDTEKTESIRKENAWKTVRFPDAYAPLAESITT